MPDDTYGDYEEQIAFRYMQQQSWPHRDVQWLANTNTNAALPNRKQREAAQRQAETEARQRNLRGNTRVPPNGLPRGRGRMREDEVYEQPPRSALPYRPIGVTDVQFVQHTHKRPLIPRSSLMRLTSRRHGVLLGVPGCRATRARLSPMPTLFGDGPELTPVTLSFKDVNGKGLLDMEVHIQDQPLVMINEGGGFRPLKPGEKVHL